jgi:hypothetical protein
MMHAQQRNRAASRRDFYHTISFGNGADYVSPDESRLPPFAHYDVWIAVAGAGNP